MFQGDATYGKMRASSAGVKSHWAPMRKAHSGMPSWKQLADCFTEYTCFLGQVVPGSSGDFSSLPSNSTPVPVGVRRPRTPTASATSDSTTTCVEHSAQD